MGGGGSKTTTSTSSTTPNNAAVDATTTQLLNKLQGYVNTGSAVYGNTLNPGAGQTTQNAWDATLNAAGNPTFVQDINNTLSEFGQIASGNRMGENDAAWNTARDNAVRDANAIFTSNGRFGSGSHVQEAARGLGAVDLARIQGNESRQMAAASALPGLFNASLLPAGVMGSVGAEQDANALALRQADADLFDRTNNRGWNDLARATSILSGTAGATGTTTTNTQTQPKTPWWQSALGFGLGALGSVF